MSITPLPHPAHAEVSTSMLVRRRFFYLFVIKEISNAASVRFVLSKIEQVLRQIVINTCIFLCNRNSEVQKHQ